MATQLKIAVATFLVLCIVFEDARLVLAGRRCNGCDFDFECDHSKEGEVCGWIPDGEAFKNQPTFGDNPTARHRGQPSKHQGSHFIGGYENRQTPDDPAGAIQGDGPKGTLTSPIFRITGRYISFLIGGGCNRDVVRAELHVEEKKDFFKVRETATGECTETMTTKTWDVAAYKGQRAKVRLVDDSSDGWGHINFDDLRGDIRC